MKKAVAKIKKKAKKSPEEQRYGTLIKNIKVQGELRKNMEDGLREVMPRMQHEIIPLQLEMVEVLKKRLLRLDELADEIGIGKVNYEYFEEYIASESVELLEQKGLSDDELANLYEKYSGETFEVDPDAKNEMSKILKEMTGVDFDFDEMMKHGINNYMEQNSERFQQQIVEQQAREEAQELADFDPNEVQKPLSRQEQLLAQDTKTLYLQLIKKLHPDLEQDEQEKIRKNGIVQQVTDAYKNNDFLTLINIQIEHIDKNGADSSLELLSPMLLKRYNKALAKQLIDIKSEIAFMAESYASVFEDLFDSKGRYWPSRFEEYKEAMENDILEIEDDLKLSYKRKKGWFKEQLQNIKSEIQGDFFGNFFSELY